MKIQKILSLIFVISFLLLMLSFSGCKNNPTTPSNGPVINSFAISPTSINKGESATLSWNVTNALSISIDQGVGTVSASGSKAVTPDKDTTYTLTAQNSDGTVNKSCGIAVSVKVPSIDSFNVSPASIYQGETATISWSVSNADKVEIDQGIGVVALSGSRAVNPDRDTSYTLTATGSGGTKNASTLLNVKWNLSGSWSGTSSSKNGTGQINFTFSQSGPNVTGTWSISLPGGSGGGNMTGTVSGNNISGNLTTSYGYSSTASGTISNFGKKIDGSGTDSGGTWTFSVTKK